MSTQQECKFAHRLNQDGTVDAICMECFQTVAFGLNEPEIEGLELEHRCIAEDRSRFDEWRAKYQPESAAENIRHFRLPRSA